MLKRPHNGLRSSALLLAGALVLASPAAAQSVARAETDPRWTPWLGCWSAAPSVESGVQAAPSTATCVIPVAGSSAVDALTIARGKIVARDRLDASVGSHRVSGQGCQGAETVNWSSTGRRVFLRSDYSCAASAKGASSTIYAISNTGDWLYVQAVRSGGGVVSTVDRRHPVDLLPAVPAEAARSIGAEGLAIRTARAAASAAMTSMEIIDAVHELDATAVRTWVLASGQSFDVDGSELAALSRADVPSSVLQAIMASTSRANAGGEQMSTHDVDEYLNRPGYTPSYPPSSIAGSPSYPMTTMYVCPPTGCFNTANAYSPYNGYAPGYYYPYNGYAPYPLIYTGGVVIRHEGRGEFREPTRLSPRDPAHEPPHPRSPTLPGPTGKRP